MVLVVVADENAIEGVTVTSEDGIDKVADCLRIPE
jgi:hypothetical protein